jgi:serine/threonine protein kinase
MANILNQEFGDFEVLAKLGEGALGTVYKARQASRARTVALKVLAPHLAKDAGFLARFKRDGVAAANMSHPNLVQVYSVGERDGVHYAAVEFVEDETLRQRLERRGKLEAREALAVAFYTARALLYAWNKSLLAHLDLGPESIFVRQAGDAKVDDVGLPKPAAGAVRLPLYTSPERAQAGREADFRADIYSLGCALYHMLTGKPPYEGDAKTLLAKHVREPLPDITKLWPACPASLARLLGKMMAKQPGDRHRNYDDLITELLAVRDEVKRVSQLQTTGVSKIEGRSFAGFTLLAKLTQDNFSVTYKARQAAPKRDAVVRLFASQIVAGAEFAARFKRDMAAVVGLSQANILQVHAAGEADGVCYVASELVEGRTLRKRMERRGQLQPREAIAIAFYLARALQHAWDTAKLAHTAITLDNVFLTDTGEVKLGDFGIARVVDLEKGAVMGSPYYTSPEQARGDKNLDCRADIYSLGCVLYHMFTGKPPCSADNPAAILARQVSEPPLAILKVWPSCPAVLAKLMDRMLAKSREERPKNYDELLAELVKVREEFRRVKAVSSRAPGKAKQDADNPSKPESLAGKVAAVLMAEEMRPAFIGAGVALGILLSVLFLWAPWKRPATESGTPGEPRAESSASRVVPFAETMPPPSSVEREPAKTYVPPARKPSKPPRTEAMLATPVSPEPPPSPATTVDLKSPEAQPAPDTSIAPRATLGRVGSREITLDMPSTTAASTEPAMTDEAFAAAVAVLPPQEQIRRVIARLQDLNPGFNGKANYKIENNAVAELALSTTGTLVPTVGVTDMTPIKTLKGLQRLVLSPAKPGELGALTDLSALSGLPLTWFSCHGNPQLHDLSPLKDLPLTGLTCGGTQVTDLTPLSGMRLVTLGINDTPVEDISVLNGMPLAVLWCQNTKIGNLSPLQGAPLRELRCDFMMARDGALLKGIRSLARINEFPAATFWKKAELASGAPAVVARNVKTASDFKSLFNGKDMVGWKQRTMDRTNGWRVRRNSMVNVPPSDDLLTKEVFANFEFYCEFQVSRRGRSGVLLRGRYRIPLLDDMGSAPTKTCSGSVFELLAPTRNASKPADTWQSLYVRLVGGTITVILNNKKVIDARDLNESAESGGSFGGDVVKSGSIVLQGSGSGVTFRNIRIKPIVEKGS